MTEDLYEAAVVGWLFREPGVNTASWPRALGFSLPSSMSEPSDKLPTNRLWQRSGDTSSRIRWQKTVTSMMLVGSLHWLLGEHGDEAAMMDRPMWPGHRVVYSQQQWVPGILNSTAHREPSAGNSPMNVEAVFFFFFNPIWTIAQSLPWFQPMRNPEVCVHSKAMPGSWPTEAVRW